MKMPMPVFPLTVIEPPLPIPPITVLLSDSMPRVKLAPLTLIAPSFAMPPVILLFPAMFIQ
jgi:hypothetical protein